MFESQGQPRSTNSLLQLRSHAISTPRRSPALVRRRHKHSLGALVIIIWSEMKLMVRAGRIKDHNYAHARPACDASMTALVGLRPIISLPLTASYARSPRPEYRLIACQLGSHFCIFVCLGFFWFFLIFARTPITPGRAHAWPQMNASSTFESHATTTQMDGPPVDSDRRAR